jgi:hypothetical protein
MNRLTAYHEDPKAVKSANHFVLRILVLFVHFETS